MIETLWLILASTGLLFFWAGCPCCGETPVLNTAECECCGTEYDVPTGGDGGPAEWILDAGTWSGTCFGTPCSNAGGTHVLSYAPTPGVGCPAQCKYESAAFTMCGVSTYTWYLETCDAPHTGCAENPVSGDEIQLTLLAGGSAVTEFNAGASPITFTCNDVNTLSLDSNSLAFCTPGSTPTITPNYA